MASLRGENKRRFQKRSGRAIISAKRTQYGPGASILKSFKILKMENVVTFKGCEHLDFQPHYSARRQQTPLGLFWMREAQPSMVQFCKKKGRIYGCDSCLSAENKQCNSFNEIEHKVSVTIEELNS